MVSVVGIRFKKAGKVYYFSPGDNLVKEGDNVIVETIKPAEDGNGFIARVYEAEGTYTTCNLSFDSSIKSVFNTDMLEYEDTPIISKNNTVTLSFKPFEIKTLRFTK